MRSQIRHHHLLPRRFTLRTVSARVSLELRLITEIKQRVKTLGRHEDNVTTMTSVTAIWAALVDIDLMPKTDGAIATLSRLNENFRCINKHILLLYQKRPYIDRGVYTFSN